MNKIGDFIIHIKFNSLYIITNTGKHPIAQVCSKHGVQDDQFNTMLNTAIFIMSPTRLEIDAIINNRPLPQWVKAIRASTYVANKTSQGGAITQRQTQANPGYPIGTIIQGTGNTGNYWIVNKQNSRDISLLWDGKAKRFCGSELERQDVIAPNSTPKPVTMAALHHGIGPGNGIPRWAEILYMTQPQTIVAPKANINPINPMLDKWAKAFAKDDEIEQKLDLKEDACKHEYKHYIGVFEVYDYCVKCDAKRMVKK